MKTPREILLNKHQSAEAALTAMRRNVVGTRRASDAISDQRAESTRSIGSKKDFTFLLIRLWEELVLPARRTWTGLAAIWLVILVFSVADGNETQFASKPAPPDQQMIAVLKERRQLMAQLLEPTGIVAEPPPMIAPRPRSERRVTFATA